MGSRLYLVMTRNDASESTHSLRAWLDARDGLITTSEATKLGVTKRQLDGLVEREVLIRVRRALYRAQGARWDLRAELRSALSQSDDGACLVLASSLHWQGYLRHPPAVPQIGVPGRRDVQRLDGRVLHRTPYASGDVVVHDGLPCLAPVPAIVHLAGHARDHSTTRMLRRAVREAVRADPSAVSALASYCSGAPVPGRAVLRKALASVPGAVVVRSDLEEDFIAFAEIWGLPRFRTNYVVGGVERDVAWVDERVIGELDTRGFHANVVNLETDRRRRRSATAAGWKHVEITNLDLRDEPARVAFDSARLLGLRDWSPPEGAAARWNEVLASAVGVWLPSR